MTRPDRAHTLRLFCIGIGSFMSSIALLHGVAVAEEKERTIAMTPNRSVIADGLGRLPKLSHATVAGELIFVSGTLGTLGEKF